MTEIVKITANSTAEDSVVYACNSVFEQELPQAIKGYCGAIVFTDSNVLHLYGARLKATLPDVPVYAMSAGEENKTAKTLFSLLGAMADAQLHRGSVLIALGGGVVGDIGGLAAALYMRGIDCIQVPTTLLAQVDSSVGGKTAIDFHGVKNLIGAFKQPKLVLCDPAFFKTLPLREIRCGLGEIVKHGALHAPLFETLYENRDKIVDLTVFHKDQSRDLAFIAEIVPENIAFKASVVKQDPHEKGLRKSLNLGHTTAHILELSGINLSHGECVLLGLLIESEIAKRYIACDEEFLEKLKDLCIKSLGGIPLLPENLAEAARLALLDKKNNAKGKVVLAVPCKPGSYKLLELSLEEYEQALNEIRGDLC